jgi:uncharacterized protein YkwD
VCAFNGWKNSAPHNNQMLEKGWKPFKRMGVGMYKGVATVWLSR